MTDIVTSEIDIASKSPEAKPFRYSGRQLARNSLYNYAGLIAPLVVGIVSIPVLVANLGTDRFGLLSLAWMVVGYFNIFDMGIGRATTKFVAEYSARGDNDGLRHVIWNSYFLSFASSLFGAIIVAACAPYAATHWLNIPENLVSEARATFYLLAAAVPIQLLAANSRGILEAVQRFDIVNAIRIPGSISSFAVPLVVLPFSSNLAVIVAAILLSKTVVLIFYTRFALSSVPAARPILPSRHFCAKLLGYGKWISVSYLITPLLGQADRFFIGAILSLSAVAYYCTPFDLITKLFIIPTGVLSVLFPVFSAYSVNHRNALIDLKRKTIKYIAVILTPMIFCFIALADQFLLWWLGPEFATQSATVLRVLAIGVLINSMARVPLGIVEALGRPDLTARMYIIELPIYLGVLYLVTSEFGILGAAILWAGRLLLESVLLYWFARSVTPDQDASTERPAWQYLLYGAAVIVSGWLVSDLSHMTTRYLLSLAIFATILFTNYRIVLSSEDRTEIIALIRRRRQGNKQ